MDNSPIIADSGERTLFESGAVRDRRSGKGRCDLLPLPQVANLLDDDPLLYSIDMFEMTKDPGYLKRAIYDLVKAYYNNDMCTAILELAIHFENGAEKYSASNWAKMIPIRCYVDSAIRHYIKFLRGDIDEPHREAAFWNLICGWWTVENNPDDKSMETIYDVQRSVNVGS